MNRHTKFITAIFISTFVLSGTVFAQSVQSSGQQIQQEAAQGSGTVMGVSPAQVRLVEQALNQRGYDTGSVDGSWDQQTSQALTIFQQAIGLEPTGQLNSRTITALGLSGQRSGQQGIQKFYGAGPAWSGGGQQGYGMQQQPAYGLQQQPQPQPGDGIQQGFGYQRQPSSTQFYRTGPAWSGYQQQGPGYGAQQRLGYGAQFGGGFGGGQQVQQGMAQGAGMCLGVSPAQIRLVEQSLNQRGYDAGNVDGTWDFQTTQGLYNFQQAIGLEPTGQLNYRTVRALGLAGQPGMQQQFYGISPAFGQQGTQGQQQFQPQGQGGAQSQRGQIITNEQSGQQSGADQ